MSEDLTQKVMEGARHCYTHGDFDKSLNFLRTGFAYDYSEGKKYFNDTAKLKDLLELYKNIGDKIKYRSKYVKKNSGKIKIGLLIPLLIDNTVAYSKRILFFAKYYDPEKYEIKVYSSEDLANFGGNSLKRGSKYLKTLSELNISFWAPDSCSSVKDAAVEIASQLENDQLDALVMQIDPTSVTAWLASYLSSIPVKILIHIGSAIFQPGLSFTMYDNQLIMKKDERHWEEGLGKQMHLTRGTDIEYVDSVKPRKIRHRAFSDDSLLIGTLSNHLDTRMSNEYKQVICDVLKEYPHVVFMPIGNIESSETLKIFKENKVDNQVLWAGPQRKPVPYLKRLDIYVCEFPEGGSQSVVEAMACGLPIVAMECGSSHHMSIASQVVGKKWTIDQYNVELYKQRLNRLIEDETYRQKNSEDMRKRALDNYSIAEYVSNVCQVIENTLEV